MSALTQSYSNLVNTLSGTAGDTDGIEIRGRAPGATVRVVGATQLAIVATGVNSGTAGTGTSSTSLAQPNYVPNWTAGDLVGKWLKVTGGGGYVAGAPILRPILANTTTTLSVKAVPGLDNTTTFEIVDLATKMDQISVSDLYAIRVASCLGPVEICGLDFSTTHTLLGLLDISDCFDVRILGCNFAQNLAAPSVSAARCQRFRVEHCKLQSSADIVVSKCQYVEVTGCLSAGGGVIDISDAVSADVSSLTATGAPSRVLSMTRVVSATAEVAASGGGATPVYLEACQNFMPAGGGLTGSGNTGYGIEIALSGNYVLTGSSITGSTNAVLFEGTPASWALEFGTSYGAMASATSRAVAQTVPTKTIYLGNVLWNGSGDHSSRELYYGILNPAQNTGIVATGTDAASAYQLPAGEHYGIGTVPSGTGVKLHNVSALPGPRCVIDNEGANALLVYPGGGGTINGSASYSLAAGAIKMFVCCDFATDKWKVL